jgi:hypothetical protein
MFKRRTSKVQHRRQVLVLQANVMSPRIVWFGILKSCRKLAKFAVVLALIGGAAWGIHLGIRRGLLENEEFRLQVIQLTPNPALDERRLVQIAGIDLKGSLFDCDVSEIQSRLRALPEVGSATVRREFPGTLIVEVVAREPHAWIASASQGILPRDLKNGLLVNRAGFAFACPPALLSQAMELPVIHLGENGEAPVAGKFVKHLEFDRLNRLYQVACKEIDGAPRWIDSLSQSRAWSLELRTREGTIASFGLGDHERQMNDLKVALEHARTRDQQIASIELIPERNLPVILAGGNTAPRAILIDESEAAPAPDRRARDLQNLLNR